jgi:hypothetical protein
VWALSSILLFELTFSNSKKHGMKPIQTHHCQGTLYKSGHVHLDTRDILEQRVDELEKRQYEFMGMLIDVVGVLKRQSETIDSVYCVDSEH